MQWPDPALPSALRDYARAGGIVVLAGPPGVGKTQLAAGLLRYLCVSCGWTVRYAPLSDVFGRMKLVMSTFGNPHEEMRSMCDKVQMLCLDEIQSRNDTSWEDHVLTQIIDLRYRERRPLLMLTNLQGPAVEESLSPGSLDRIRETGGIFDLSSWPNQRACG